MQLLRTVISSDEVRIALQDPVRAIVNGIQTVLERTPPELSADLTKSGCILAGGGACCAGSTR